MPRDDVDADPTGTDDVAGPSVSESWLVEVAAAPAVRTEREPAERLDPGVVVDGHYRIEGVLGVGGMGIVYRAWDRSLERVVALKLHRWADDRSRDRLLREAKVMAKLSHPNVLAVHVVGTWQNHVYLAAELVDGVTARRWQRTARPWPDVVRLYLAAGEGLAAAHRIGLVHRDFKPDNVLVGDDGRARVADFGLARRSGGADSQPPQRVETLGSAEAVPFEMLRLTRTGTRVGTPAYMAPEQFGDGVVDARADQFAFCVALFEALLGTRPFPAESSLALVAAIGRGPVEPDQAGSVPSRVRRVLRRGLQSAPEARYPSMDALLTDLRHTLGPPRIRWLMAGGVIVGLGALTAARWSNSAQCADAGAALHEVWNPQRAQRLAGTHAATGIPWTRVGPWIDDYARRWGEARSGLCETRAEASAEFTDRARACLDAGRRDLDAVLETLESGTSDALHRAPRRLSSLVQPADCRDPEFVLATVAPPSDVSVRARVEALRIEIGRLREVRRGGVAAGPGLLRLREVATEAAALDYPPLTAEVVLAQGLLHMANDEPQDAETKLQDAYFSARAARHHRVSAFAALKLARLVGFAMSRVDAGLLWGRHAVTEAEQDGVPESLLASAEHNLGIMEDTAGHWDQARALYDRALARLDPDDDAHAVRRAEILISIAALQGGRGEVDQAIETAERALSLLEWVHGPDHESMVPAIGNIGYALSGAGRYQEAYRWHRRAFDLTEAQHGPDSHRLAVPLLNAAVAAHGSGDYPLARRHYQQTERLVVAAFGPDHADIALVSGNLALIAEAEGDHAEAALRRRRALEILNKTLGEDAPATLRARNALASSQLLAGKLDEACATYDAVAEHTQRLQGESRVLAAAREGQGRCALARDQPEAAVSLLRDAIRVGEASAWAPVGRAGCHRELAAALWALDPPQPEAARAHARQAVELYDAGDDRPHADEARSWLAEHAE